MLAQQEFIQVHALPLFAGEVKPSKHEQVRDEGVAQSPLHQVLTPHWLWQVMAEQIKHIRIDAFT